MYTKDQIFEQLDEMNAPRDGIVVIHSSLKAIGEFEGRGEGLLEALIEYFTAEGGLLCIPTHTWGFLLSREIAMDMTTGETCIGTLPTLAAKHPNAHRSIHPTHSIAVFGDHEKAEELIKDDRYCNTPASPKSVMGKIYERGGHVLLIGVGHNRNTYIHCVEEILDVQNRLTSFEVPYKIKLKSGEIIEGMTRYHLAEGIQDVSAHYPKYEEAFKYFDIITHGLIGNAKSQLLSARAIKSVVELIRKRSGGIELMADDKPLDENYYM